MLDWRREGGLGRKHDCAYEAADVVPYTEWRTENVDFFRFDTASKVILYGWVNDASTLPKAGASTDPYSVFRGMLIGGDPPHDWNKLLDPCREPAAEARPEGIGGLFDERLDDAEPASIAGPARRRAPTRIGR